MSWRTASAGLARELATLVVEGSSAWLTAGQLDQALAVRRELFLLLGRVAGDVRTASAKAPRLPRGEVTAEQLETDPVLALEHALRAHRAPRGRYLPGSGLGEGAPAGEVSWAAVSRWTELAARAWQQVDLVVLTGAERWSTVADVAALAEAVTVLDRQLLAAASLPNRLGLGPMLQLEDAVTGGLRLAAREAGELAAAGPLPDWDQPGDRPALRPTLLVRSAQDLAAAQDRLVDHLSAADTIDPVAVTLVAAGQARLLAAAAAALNGSTTYAGRGQWAADVSRRVADSVLGAHALSPGPEARFPGRAVNQSRELIGFVRDRMIGGQPSEADLAALAAAVARAPRVLGALASQAARAWRSGAWQVPDPYGERVNWVRSRPGDREPRLCTGLSAAAAYSVAQLGAAGVVGPVRAGPTPPREVLAEVSWALRPNRPPLPGNRPSVVPEWGSGRGS